MDRGQGYTLEAVVAGMLLVGSLLFALQVTAVTPLSASTSSQHIENQQEAVAAGVLSTAADDGSLEAAVLRWNPTDTNGDGEGQFHGAPTLSYYRGSANVTDFELGRQLRQAYEGRGIVFNLHAVYLVDTDDDGDVDSTARQRIVYRGEPSDNAVTASRTVTLFDDDVLYNDTDLDGVAEPTGDVLGNDTYVHDVTDSDGTDEAVYNAVKVVVVAWRQ